MRFVEILVEIVKFHGLVQSRRIAGDPILPNELLQRVTSLGIVLRLVTHDAQDAQAPVLARDKGLYS